MCAAASAFRRKTIEGRSVLLEEGGELFVAHGDTLLEGPIERLASRQVLQQRDQRRRAMLIDQPSHGAGG